MKYLLYLTALIAIFVSCDMDHSNVFDSDYDSKLTLKNFNSNDIEIVPLESYDILWEDNVDNKLKIELFKSENFVDLIVDEPETEGKFSWTPTLTLLESNDYHLKFSTKNNNTVVNSSPFKIVGILDNAVLNSDSIFYNETYQISWNDNISENVKIELYKGSDFVQDIIASTASNGSYSWSVPTTLTAGTDYKVKITSVNTSSLYDYSDIFTISLAPYIAVTNPASSTTWRMGSSVSIQWSDNISENVKIELFKGDDFVQDIVSSTSSNGSYSWTVPTSLTAGTDYKVKITSVNNSNLYDYSDTFTVSLAPDITVTNPTSSTTWQIGSNASIQWDDNISENVKIELYKGDDFVQDIIATTSSNGSYSWTVPTSLTAGTDYKVKITSVNNSSLYDYSDTFTVSLAPDITVTNPTSSTTWQMGSSVSIQWSDNISENVKIELYKGSNAVQTISSSTSSNGSYSWTVSTSLTPGSDYKVKITSVNTSS
ncbi:MAG: hypothetical protein JXR48_02010, partial [Candidatus Delongbacteria bacterium]|nr:hypothetical protein [Candidatus Delongbacteria bacterium]MBN2833720.1 hypothetical protein [Candidatus Delongbacteria bacterium]